MYDTERLFDDLNSEWFAATESTISCVGRSLTQTCLFIELTRINEFFIAGTWLGVCTPGALLAVWS